MYRLETWPVLLGYLGVANAILYGIYYWNGIGAFWISLGILNVIAVGCWIPVEFITRIENISNREKGKTQ